MQNRQRRVLALSWILAVLLSLPAAAQTSSNAARRDADGEPLPPGALFRLGTRAFRIHGEYLSIDWSPDGKSFACLGLNSKAIYFFDADTGRLLNERAIDGASQLVYSPDGAELAIRIRNDRVVRLDAKTMREIKHHDIDGPADLFIPNHRTSAYSPDGKYLAFTSRNGFQIVDRRSHEVVHSAATLNRIWSIRFSGDSRRFVVSELPRMVTIWNLEKREAAHAWDENKKHATGLGTSPDGRQLAIGSLDMAVVDLDAGKTRYRLQGDHPPKFEGDSEGVDFFIAAEFTPDGKQIVGATEEGIIYVWDAATQARKQKIQCPAEYLHQIVVSPDSRRVAACDFESRLFIWDLASGQLLFDQPPGNNDAVKSLAFSPDGNTIATGSRGRSTLLWNARTGQHLHTLPASSSALQFTSAGDLLTVRKHNQPLQLWNAKTGVKQKEWPHEGGEFNDPIAFSRNAAGLVHLEDWPGQDGNTRSWRADAFRLPAMQRIGTGQGVGAPRALTLSHDGVWAAFAIPKTIVIYDIEKTAVLHQLDGHKEPVLAMAFTPDRRFLISSSADQSVRVWELATCREVARLSHVDRGMTSVAVAANGRVVAAGGSEERAGDEAGTKQHDVRLWELASGKLLATISGQNAGVTSLAFSPDETQVVTGLNDSTAIVWETPAAVRDAIRTTAAIPAAEQDAVWRDLGSPDAKRGQAAVLRLVQDTDAALTLAEKHLEPARSPADKDVFPLIEKLAAADFKERQEAMQALTHYGDRINGQLTAAAPDSKTPEIRLRAAELLQKARITYPLPPSLLASARAVQMLEWIDDPRAKALLAKLATGAEGMYLTTEARSALARRQFAPPLSKAEESAP